MEEIQNQLSLIEGTLVFSGSISMIGLAILIWMVLRIYLKVRNSDEVTD